MRTLTLLLIAGLAAPGLGQRKPPPPPDRGPDPRVDQVAFMDAYDRAEEPRMVVICGLGTDPGGANRVGAKAFKVFDASGSADLLRTEIDRRLIDAGVDLVELSALDEVVKRQVDVLGMQGDARGAIRQLKAALSAEIVIFVWMLPTQGWGKRTKYRVTVETLSGSRGTKIGAFSFDWREGTTAEDIKAYASAVTRKVCADFTRNFGRGQPAGSRFTVDVFGVRDARTQLKLQQEIEGVEGVKRVRADALSSSASDPLARFRVRFHGSRIELMAALEGVGGEALGVPCRVADSVGENIILRTARAKQEQEVDAIFDFVNPRGKEARARLTELYGKQGRPKIAILVNRALAPATGGKPGEDKPARGGKGGIGGITADSVVLVLTEGATLGAGGARPPGGVAAGADAENKPTDATEAELDTRKVEDKFFKKLLPLDLILVDPAIIRRNIAAKVKKQQVTFKNDELAAIIGSSSGVDILIHGIGRVDRRRRPAGISYSFRVSRLSNGEVLASETWGADTLTLMDASVEALQDNVADEVCPVLMRQMVRRWEPPNTLSVTVNNARNQDDVFRVMDAFQTALGDDISNPIFGKHEGGRESGVGNFSVQYRVSYEELVRRIKNLSSQALDPPLPFDLEATDTDRTSLSIRIK